MRKLLHEVQEIDRYLFHTMAIADRLVFQARMIVSTELKEKVKHQRHAHRLIRWWARDTRRKQLDTLYDRIMKDKQFSAQIDTIFKSS